MYFMPFPSSYNKKLLIAVIGRTIFRPTATNGNRFVPGVVRPSPGERLRFTGKQVLRLFEARSNRCKLYMI